MFQNANIEDCLDNFCNASKALQSYMFYSQNGKYIFWLFKPQKTEDKQTKRGL